MSLIDIGGTEQEAKGNCIKLSKQHKGMYVYAVTAFGLYATIEKRLNVFAPSDSVFDWYVLNGKVKTFSEAQKISDWNATPLMS